jgi:Mg2+ and Co2+ transporter CorA
MSELILSLLLDGTVALLLAVTIFYCIKLNRRVQLLQDSKSELAHLIQQFDESTKQATVSIHEIHKASKKINENIQMKLDKANYLADDLAFMIERANKTADRIEQQISSGRTVASPSRAQEAHEEPRRQASAASVSEPQRPVQATERSRERTTLRSGDASSRNEPAKSNAGIEAMMERISELRGGQPQSGRAQRPMARMRTSSEQDLARALKEKE